jgi:hypothetical protein
MGLSDFSSWRIVLLGALKKWLPNLSFFIITQFELLSTLSLCSLAKFVYAAPAQGGDHRLRPGKTRSASARTVILVDDF